MSSNTRAGLWLLLDMCLHISALSLVKALGTDYPAVQLVLVRALTGLLFLSPWIVRSHRAFFDIKQWRLQLLRVCCSAIALSCGYYAVTHVPLALFTTVNYLRPSVLMIMAVLFLNERINRRRWLAVVLGFVGVLVAVNPDEYTFNASLWALFGAVLAGSAATILLRQLKGNPEIVMMVFYTAGLAVLTAPVALVQWVSFADSDLLALLAIGIFAQAAQLCFLRAHWLGDVGFLGPISYSSLILSALAGFFFFSEIPSHSLFIGAFIIIFSAVLLRVRA